MLVTEAVHDWDVLGSRAFFFVLHELEDRGLFLAERLSAEGIAAVFYLVTDEDMEDCIRKAGSIRTIITIPVEADLQEVL